MSNVDGNSHELSRFSSDIGRNERAGSRDQVLLNNDWDKKEGWPVVAAGSAIFFVYLGLVYSYGIVQLHLADAHLASASTLSFIGSLGAAISPLMGMIVARIIKRIGYRATAFIGSIFLGIGEFTAGWSTQSVPAMFATQGLLFGIGAAMLFLVIAYPFSCMISTVPMVQKERGLATGLVYGGAGLGSTMITISLEELISVTGLEGALKILGGMAWGICIPASYFLKAPAGSARAVSSIQWRLLRSLRFILMLLMGAIATFPLFVPPFLLPLYISSIGFFSRVAASILAAWNFASALGRIGMGFGADLFLGPVNSMILSLTVIGISAMALWPFASSLGLLIFFAIINGMGSGGFFSLMPVVVGAVFGDGQLANIMSMLSTSWTFGYFLGSPIAGYLLDAYGGTDAGLAAFRPAIFYAGSLTLASAGLLLLKTATLK
ncbi:major facilitator superfamily domain-containing protein [Aspergillus transmontanensis]|uniref:Major facilitator superfamily domain-containing protein n=1 Tax=Aspergillus transmontanensis TaxID=1034304 RepID=A0A5N6W341_9EURO|nr:major facilitator superfamily domain-containing protein [Aspergillus transmontanensis]